MHGGKSKRGSEHWNYRNGLQSKDVKEVGAMMGRFFNRPVEVRVVLYPETLEEIAANIGRKQRLSGLIVKPEQVTIDEWVGALRAARRLLAQELTELRAEAADGP
jgi:hypothetical protein